MTTDQVTRYRDLLGVCERPSSLAGLTELVTAHLSRVPFENVSKLIRHARGQAPVLDALDEFLDRIEHLHLGGTCYACAVHFNALLRHLGYDARLCGAAMSLPDVHAVNIVAVEGREFLVDVGYGAPLLAPPPLDAREASTVALGPDRYVLHPRDTDGRSRLEHLREGAVVHGYTVDPTPRDPAHFAPVIAHSYRPESEFLNRLRIVRHTPARSISLSDLRVTVIEGDTVRERILPGPEALGTVVEILLGIPAAVTGEAVAALGARLG